MPYTNQKLIEYKQFLKGKTATVIGIGISNIPLIDFLLENGVKVTARDMKSRQKLEENPNIDFERLDRAGVTFVTGEGYLDNIKEDIVFKGPGIRYDKPEILSAYENGSIITSEMEAFISLCPSKIIAVTGSNGKTTTTTLISKILENAGKKVWLGGNIGNPLLSHIEEIKPDDFTVLELSSFQLHTINRFENKGLPFAKITFPDVGVITNVSPNHLDWHTDMDEYAESKCAIFTHMEKDGILVTNRCSDDYVKAFAHKARTLGRNVRTFSAFDECEKSNDKNFAFYDKVDKGVYVGDEKILDADKIVIPGLHNVENYMAAILATYDFVSKDAAKKTSQTFAGVAHRLELVVDKYGTKYYNSSIDSSPSRTLAALSCFSEEYDGRINIILGGYDKHIPFDELAEPICKRRIRAFITGHTKDAIYNAITSSKFYDEKTCWLTKCENFDSAVRFACAAALPGDIVLMSPACASFDEFANFEKRGERFRYLVKEITSDIF